MDEVKKIMEYITKGKEDLNQEGVAETPKRYKRMIDNFFTYNKELVIVDEKARHNIKPNQMPVTVFKNNGQYNQLIIYKGQYVSFCEHHILPFYGKYWLGYLPNKKIIGISKVQNIVDYFAHRLQLQERLNVEIVEWFWKNIKPKFVVLKMTGEHLCEYVTTGREGKMVTQYLRPFKAKELLKEFEAML